MRLKFLNRLLQKFPSIGRRHRRRIMLRAARSEVRSLRAELALAMLAGTEKPFAGRISKKFKEAFGSKNWYILPDDDARQDRVIGDLRNYIKNAVGGKAAALEIGPCHAGILRKRDDYNVSIVDHTDLDGLIRKYAGHGLDVSRIEPVDFVWHDEPLTQAVNGMTFDAVVASHVVEHAPDLIAFLNECAGVLNDSGSIYLIVPDRRYEFDFFQPLTDTAKVLGDHRQRRTRHSFESFYRKATLVRNAGAQDWDEVGISDLRFAGGDPKQAAAAAEQYCQAKDYVDGHEYYFTPMSFATLVEELRYLGEIEVALEILTRTRGCEFLAVLRKAQTGDDVAPEAYQDRKMAANILVLLEELERIHSARKLLLEQQPDVQ